MYRCVFERLVAFDHLFDIARSSFECSRDVSCYFRVFLLECDRYDAEA